MSWDCITIWVLKLISCLTAKELLMIAEAAETDLQGINLSWMQGDDIMALESEDEELQRKNKRSGEGDGLLRWMPKEVCKLVNCTLGNEEVGSSRRARGARGTRGMSGTRGTTRTGVYIVRRIMLNAVENEETICGRLYLLQSEKKKKKSKTGLPSKKTTRPITVSSVIQKLLEKILLKRITDTVIRNTEVENAGFKPHMSCELQLQRMKMFLLNNIKRKKPTYIVSCDIKSAYDNVNQDQLFEYFQENILKDIGVEGGTEEGEEGDLEPPDSEEYRMAMEFRKATEMLLYYVLKAPNVRIYEQQKIIHLTKGVQQGGCASPILYIAYANRFAKAIKELAERRGLTKEEYLIMNWADDVNYMFTNIEDAKHTIRALKRVAEELKLPFSKEKCKLVPLYPNKYPYKFREKIGVVLDDLVTISKEAKILGITWNQTRFRKGRLQMF